ncbi:PREDICTED: mitochondrial import receptor subunit TOM70-like isoform X2 [Wasmannia auropunctata]|uniref:mitochondrial import receptor subunit TOM70-like isoform X2 n=1 Tax=Wasmannia auropunctata TaxID=64793 RepID=UPI0005EF30B6|nr:PREDICTED: mitochondrial import receptor subunit TOM70-like isoform X2 [Wasmannia auropunctata]
MSPLEKARKCKNIGNEYFKERKYHEAIVEYSKAIDICPRRKATLQDLAIFYQNRAAANEQLKKYSDVKADCTKALELNPKYMKALLRRARASEQLEDLEAALDDLTTARIYEHSSIQATNAITMADEILEKLVKQYVQEYLANKKFIMQSKEAITLYILSFLKDPVFSRLQHPENIPEFFKKPLQALKDKKYDDIIPLCTEVIQKPEFDTLPSSSKLEVLLLRATFYMFLGKQDSAIQEFEKILSSKDASNDMKTNVLIKRGDSYMVLEKVEMAFKDYESAIDINPTYSDIYYHRGVAYWLMCSYAESKHDFDTAVLYNPNFCMANIRRYCLEYHLIKKVCDVVATECVTVELADKVAKNLKNCLESCRNITERSFCYTSYAEMLSESRQYKKADTSLIKAIKEDPESALNHMQRAVLHLKWKDDVDKAEEYLNKALDLDERCDKAHEMLGYIAVKRGNLEEAIKLFDKALSLCRTSMELSSIYNMKERAKLQLKVKNRGIDVIPRGHISFRVF